MYTKGMGRNMILRVEQKLVEWLMDLMSRFWHGKQFVLNNSVGTFPNARTKLQLPKQRKVVVFEEESTWF